TRQRRCRVRARRGGIVFSLGGRPTAHKKKMHARRQEAAKLAAAHMDGKGGVVVVDRIRRDGELEGKLRAALQAASSKRIRLRSLKIERGLLSENSPVFASWWVRCWPGSS